MLEQFVNLPADLVIFYGGYNENILPLNYDPRPGYPYNYYYKHECPAWRLFLIRYSAILGEAEKRFGIISGIRSMKDSSPELQRQWYESIVSMYFQTLADAEKLSTGVIRNQLGKSARFIALYQPYQVPDAFSRSHAQIRKRIGELSYGVDLSACLDSLSASGAEVYFDRVHVSPGADAVIAGRIADEVVRSVSFP